MSRDDEIDALAEACLRVHASVEQTGTPEMIALARLLLYQLAQRIHAGRTASNGRAEES